VEECSTANDGSDRDGINLKSWVKQCGDGWLWMCMSALCWKYRSFTSREWIAAMMWRKI